ncbi:separin [Copidosoma floridanum]|uniref:separin n=1 Tax=Copidosoma floridanum TaxID=29053 RepID=UPI0006C9C419|nr:separin [Copidosoma floridanum]
MSSPTESALRELPSSRPSQHLGVDSQLQRNISYLGKHQFAPASPEQQQRGAPDLTKITLNKLLGRSRTKPRPPATLKQLETQLNEFFRVNQLNIAVSETTSIRKILAIVCIANGKELEACCHLIASHANCLRQQIFLRHLKSKLRADIIKQPMVLNLDPNHLDVDNRCSITSSKTVMSTVKKLPSEWYVVQVTAVHEPLKDSRHRIQNEEYSYLLKPTHGLHLVVIPTGENAIDPICITVPKPDGDSSYDLRTEIEKLLNNNKSDLTAVYCNKDLYWKMRKKQNDQMSIAIQELECSWLKEWKILFQADYIDNLDLVQDIHSMIDKLIADDNTSRKTISQRTRWLLKKIATSAWYLKSFEIERAVKYVLPTQKKLAKNIILSIIAKNKVIEPLKDAKRKVLLLILDECLDHISFESMQLLKHQPVTRFPSLHILYALFEQHKSSIKNGYKIVHHSDNIGTFIVNPSLDLMHMETRIRSFLNHWLPKWEGLYGIKPDIEFFKKALMQHEILMYNGHGSGVQFMKGEDIERMRVIASVLLFGCSSLKLLPVGGRQAPYGVSYQYLMACSPCILGMLWEVTDGDIDRMTAEFMSKWIPSKVKKPWSDVDKVSWNRGLIEYTNKDKKLTRTIIENEQDMLLAVAISKDVCKQFMTSAAIVMRGLPIKLVD